MMWLAKEVSQVRGQHIEHSRHFRPCGIVADDLHVLRKAGKSQGAKPFVEPGLDQGRVAIVQVDAAVCLTMRLIASNSYGISSAVVGGPCTRAILIATSISVTCPKGPRESTAVAPGQLPDQGHQPANASSFSKGINSSASWDDCCLGACVAVLARRFRAGAVGSGLAGQC